MNQVSTAQRPDAELLFLFIEQHDEAAFEQLVHRHVGMVAATVRRVLRNEEDIQDACQVTFFALAKCARKLRLRDAVAGWLHRTALNSAIQIHRTNSRRRETISSYEDTAMNVNSDSTVPWLGIDETELEEILADELSHLPDELLTPIVLCDLEGLTQQQAAAQVGLPASTLKNRLAKARAAMRHRLSKRGIGVAAFAAWTAACTSTNAAKHEAASQIASKAMLFAAGRTHTEIGVRCSVIQHANKVVFSMATLKAATVLAIVLSIVLFGSSLLVLHDIGTEAVAGTIFIDDFHDGSISNNLPVASHGVPITWESKFLAELKVVDSALSVGAPNAIVPGARARVGDHEDASLRSRVRLIEGDSVALGVRYTQPGGFGNGYFGGIAADGTAFAGISSGENSNRPAEFLGQQPTDLRVAENDVMIQLDAIDDEVSLRVWGVDERMPDEPTISFQDDRVTSGDSVVAFAMAAEAFQPQAIDARFQFIRLDNTVIPEPCTALMASVGLTACALLARRRHGRPSQA